MQIECDAKHSGNTNYVTAQQCMRWRHTVCVYGCGADSLADQKKSMKQNEIRMKLDLRGINLRSRPALSEDLWACAVAARNSSSSFCRQKTAQLMFLKCLINCTGQTFLPRQNTICETAYRRSCCRYTTEHNIGFMQQTVTNNILIELWEEEYLYEAYRRLLREIRYTAERTADAMHYILSDVVSRYNPNSRTRLMLIKGTEQRETSEEAVDGY